MTSTTTREEVIQAEANYAVLGKNKTPREEALWRRDPDKSFSDWKIVVSTYGSSHQETYHVHKVKLGHGHRRSMYFENLFQGKFKESGTSNLELHPLAAICFPKLLDFVYEHDTNIMIDTSSATALFHLGNYLDIKVVQEIAEQFIRKDISVVNIGTYFEHSNYFPEVNDILGDFVFENLSRLSLSVDDIAKASLAQWERVATRVAEMDDARKKEDSSQNFSFLFAEFAKSRTPQALQEEAQIFQSIFSEKCMPVVHPDAALSLAEVHQQLPSSEEPTSTATGPSFLDRCCHALPQSERFQYQVMKCDADTYSRLGKLPASFVAAAWMKTEELDSKEHPRLGPMRRELESKLQPYSYEQVMQEYQKTERKRRMERDAAFGVVRAASPEASFDEIRASPQVQSIEERRVMEREAFDKVLDAKSLELKAQVAGEAALLPNDNQSESERKERKSKQKGTRREQRVKRSKEEELEWAKGEDPYPVNTKVFHRDEDDGHGARAYPAVIVKLTGPETRHITYLNYNQSHDREVHISELLEWTQERQDQYENETVPELKENDKQVEELRRKVNQEGGATRSDSIESFVVGETYYLPEPSGIEYPVKLRRICPKAKGKCCIKYVHYGTTKTVPLISLLPATKQREKIFRDRQDFDRQQKILKKLRDAEESENKQKARATKRTTSSGPSKKAAKKRMVGGGNPGPFHAKRQKV